MTPNLNGKILENFVENIFRSKGFTILYEKEYDVIKHQDRIVIKNVKFITIYNLTGRSEFVIKYQNRSIRVECKWQQSNGSVDEKYPYLFENCKIYPEDEIVILLDGGGYKPQAKEWLMKKALEYTKKSIKVFNMSEFSIYCNQEFL